MIPTPQQLCNIAGNFRIISKEWTNPPSITYCMYHCITYHFLSSLTDTYAWQLGADIHFSKNACQTWA